jgi:hypothetical protein
MAPLYERRFHAKDFFSSLNWLPPPRMPGNKPQLLPLLSLTLFADTNF